MNNIAKICRKIVKKSTPINLISLSFLNRIKYYSSHQNSQPQQWKLSDDQQKTIISLQTINYILSIDEQQLLKEKKSIRQRIFSREHLRRLLKKPQLQQPTLGEQLKTIGEFRNLNDAGFSQNNIISVLLAFDLNGGIKYNPKIYSTIKTNNAACNSFLVFSPTFITAKIIKTIIQSQNKKIVSGQRDIGKSFAYLIYDFLSSFIIDFRIKLQGNKIIASKRFMHLIDSQQLKRIKKLFYIPISTFDSPYSLLQLFRAQLNLHQKENKYIHQPNTSIQSVTNKYLTFLKQFYTAKNIQTVCIFDEFEVIQAMYIIMGKIKFAKPQLVRYCEILDSLENRFTLSIYNSSKLINAQLVGRWNNYNSLKKYINVFHGLGQGDLVNLQFYHILSIKEGHIYFYQLLWQELCKRQKLLMDPQNKKLKELYDSSFGIGNCTVNNDEKQVDFTYWKHKIQFKSIYNNLANDQLTLSLHQILSCVKQKAIKTIFRSMQKMIEKNHYQQLINRYALSFNKDAKSSKISIQRLQMLMLILLKATDQQRLQNNSFKILIQVSNLLERAKQNYYNFNNQQIILYCSQYPGEFCNIQKTQIKLNFENQSYFELNIIFNNFNRIHSWLGQLIRFKRLNQQYANRYFNILHFHLLKSEPSQLTVHPVFNMKISTKTFSYNQRRYIIMKAIPFQVIRHTSQLQLQKSLSIIMNSAIESPQLFYLGYPTQLKIRLKRKKENIFDINYKYNDLIQKDCKQIFHFPQNALFDFLLVRKIKGENRVEIGTFQNSIIFIEDMFKQANKIQIERQLLRISQQYKLMIDWQHTIFAPENRIKKWLGTVSQRKQRGQVQEWYLNGSRKQIKSLTSQEEIIGTIKLNISNLIVDKKINIFKLSTENKRKEQAISEALYQMQKYLQAQP